MYWSLSMEHCVLVPQYGVNFSPSLVVVSPSLSLVVELMLNLSLVMLNLSLVVPQYEFVVMDSIVEILIIPSLKSWDPLGLRAPRRVQMSSKALCRSLKGGAENLWSFV